MVSPLLSVAATREMQPYRYFVARSTRGLLRRGIGDGFAFRMAVTKFLTLCSQLAPPAARIALTASYLCGSKESKMSITSTKGRASVH